MIEFDLLIVLYVLVYHVTSGEAMNFWREDILDLKVFEGFDFWIFLDSAPVKYMFYSCQAKNQYKRWQGRFLVINWLYIYW